MKNPAMFRQSPFWTEWGWRALLPLSLLILIAVGARAWAEHGAEAALLRADPETILSSPTLAPFALRLGRNTFMQACASCHGERGRGLIARGVPDLTDRDRLYGEGHVAEIETIVLYGIRSGHSKGQHLASMPAYATSRPYEAEPLPSLSPGEIGDVVQLLRSYEGQAAPTDAVARGVKVYAKAGCWDCHGAEGGGDAAVGAPDLRDRVALNGGSTAALTRSVSLGRAGVSPAFAGRLSPVRVRAVAAYVASLSLPGVPK